MDFVKAEKKIVDYFHPVWRLCAEIGDDVVHVLFEERWSLKAFGLGDFESLVDGVGHLYVRDGDHQRQTNGTGIFGRKYGVVVDELGSREAEVEQLADVVYVSQIMKRWRG